MSTVEVGTLRKVFTKFMDDIYNYNDRLAKNRLGKILTVVDGAIADETQRKAIKDLIHDGWYAPLGIDYPQPRHFAEVMGFKWGLDAMPNNPPDHNPYKELIKE